MNKAESIIDIKIDRKTVQKSAFNTILIQVVFKLKGLITMPIMTYFLLPKEMGIFNLITVTAYLLYPMFSMNLINGSSVFLVQEKSKEQIRRMYNTAINGSILFYLIFTPIFWLAMSKFGGEYYQYLYLLLPMLYSILYFLMFENVLIFFQKTSLLVKIVFYKDLSVTILTVLLVIGGFSFYGMIFAAVITDIIAGVYMYHLIKNDLPYKMLIDKTLLIKFLKISLPLIPVFVFSWVVQSSDSYFLAYFKGEDSVGKYSVTYGLSNIILILTYALNMFWTPVSARLWVENREKYRQAFTKIFAAFCAFLFLVVLLFEFNSKIIFQIMVKRKDYFDAYAIMGVIALAFSMQVLITLLTAPLYSNRNTGMIFYSYLFGSIVNTFLNFTLIPSYGIWGAAISTAVSYLAILLLISYFNYRVVRFHFIDERLSYIAPIFIILWVGVFFLREHLQLHQVLIGNAVLMIAVVPLICFMVLKNDERQFVFSFINELKSGKFFKERKNRK